jgi:anhydro-N-acetylmuramic acid kinase
MAELLKALGVMSGTSMDGVDIAMLGTDGEATAERGAFASEPYPAALRARIAEGLDAARAITERSQRPAVLAALETELTDFHGKAILGYLGRTGIEAAAIDVIGYHGHTVLHRPEQGLTVQLGDGAMLARMTGRPVVNDLRAADMRAGGEGAPLVPVYHRMLAGRAPDRPVAFINIGGVANVTWVGRDGALLAFDCGPGNALMDDWALRHTGQPVDVDGALARSGKADEAVLRTYLLNGFLERPAPKSLDRGDFTLTPVEQLSAADGAATLARLTAATIARAAAWFPEQPTWWIVGGGGRRNRFLMELLAWHLTAPVAPAEALGLDGDAIEAEAWAYLAVRSLKGLPITFPTTTRVSRPTTGGVLHQAG